MLVSLNDRKAKVTRTDYSQALNVTAGGTATITITPPVGELWRIKLLRLAIFAPTGATAGTHRVIIGLYDVGTEGGIIDLTSNFGDAISIADNIVATATNAKVPSAEQAMQNGILNMVATNDTPIKIWYSNSTTGGIQAGTANIKITREVEYVV